MTGTITDVIFDYCDVLLDWRPRIPLEGQYPPGVIDMFFSDDDPHGFRYYDRLSDSGWDEERILSDYETEHGPAVAWVFRIYFERQRLALAGLQSGMGGVAARSGRLGRATVGVDELHDQVRQGGA